MEIIRRGCIPEDRTYEAECKNCLTQISFTGAEATRMGNMFWVTCPVCNLEIKVPVGLDLNKPAFPIHQRLQDD